MPIQAEQASSHIWARGRHLFHPTYNQGKVRSLLFFGLLLLMLLLYCYCWLLLWLLLLGPVLESKKNITIMVIIMIITITITIIITILRTIMITMIMTIKTIIIMISGAPWSSVTFPWTNRHVHLFLDHVSFSHHHFYHQLQISFDCLMTKLFKSEEGLISTFQTIALWENCENRVWSPLVFGSC